MPGWHAALGRRAAAGNGQPAAGGSWRAVARPPRRPANPSPQLTEARITPPNGAAAPDQPRAQVSISDRPLRRVLVWGALLVFALVASAAVVSRLT
jgi:hypothetical protein